MKTYFRRQCYDKYWRCPGWVGGGFKYPKVTRCDGGSLLVPDSWNTEKSGTIPRDKLWRFKFYRCRKDCGVIALPYITRYFDWTWWRWQIAKRNMH